MPRWDFTCKSCQTVREYTFLTYEASTKATCETCGAPLVRQPSLGAFVLKGQGWYRDGYSSPKK